jgi:hypothetical protein
MDLNGVVVPSDTGCCIMRFIVGYTPIRDDLLLGLPPGLKPLCAPACIAVARYLGLGHMSGGCLEEGKPWKKQQTTDSDFGIL